MQEEFEVYRLSDWLMTDVGMIKVALLIAGVIFPLLTKPAAIAMAGMMLGSVSMHIQLEDRLKKALPPLTLLLCMIVAVA